MADPVGFQPQTLPDLQPSGGTPAFESGELEQGIRPTRWGKLFGLSQQASLNSPVGVLPGFEGAWTRWAVQHSLEQELKAQNRPKIDPKEANERYPGMPVPFNEPVYPEIADLMYSDQQRRKKLQEWVDRGPETGWALGLAASATTALDPINLALNFAGGAALRAAGVQTGLGVTFAENLAGNLAADIPSYFQLRRERQDVSLGETLETAIAGAALGTGISKLVEGVGRLASRGSRQIQERSLKAAIQQHEAGARIDVTPGVITTTLREAGVPKAGTINNPYRFEELGHPSERIHYSAIESDVNQRSSFGRDYGDGVYAVDDGVVANHHAANPESLFHGKVEEIEIPSDAKFLDLRTKLDETEAKAFVRSAEEEIGKFYKLSKDTSVDKFLDQVAEDVRSGALPQSALNDVAGVARELGYDGYRFVSEIGGVPRSNGVLLFDEARTQVRSEFQANKDITPSVADGEAIASPRDLSRPDSLKTYSPETERELESLKSRPAPKEEDLDPIVKQQEEQAKRLLKQASESDPDLQEELAGLRRAQATDKQEAQVLRDFAECYLKGMT